MENKLIKRAASIVRKSLAYGDYIDIVAPSIYRGGLFDGKFFFGGNGLDYRFAYKNFHSSVEAYNSCPPLAAVVNRKAQCYINGETMVVNSQNNPARGSDAAKLTKLLKKPNPIQSWRAFEAQQYIYIQLFGFCVTLPIIPAGFEASGPIEATSLWNIPPYLLSIQEKQQPYFFAKSFKDLVEKITFTWNANTIDLPLENLIIFKDFTPGKDNPLFPESRIRALTMPIANVIAAYLSRNELINYAGAQGIFSPEAQDVTGTIPLKPEEKNQLQDDFKRQYGIQRGQFRYIIAPTQMKWQAIGKPTRDLMLFEEIVDDIMRICDGYSYPSPLLNSEKGPNVSNTGAYQEQIYTDGIIPESLDLYEQWNNYFFTEDYNIKMVKDYAHVPALQDNRVEAGKALYYLNQSSLILWQNNMITANQWLEMNELPTVPGYDLYYSDFVKQGLVFAPNPQANNNSDITIGGSNTPSTNESK